VWDDEMKQHAINEIRQKISNNEKIWVKFVETKLMQDQLLRNYGKTCEKILPAIDYIADCIESETWHKKLDVTQKIEQYIQSEFWYDIRKKNNRTKPRLDYMIYFHYNYNGVEDVEKKLLQHKKKIGNTSDGKISV
jgi:hypothetical protein